MKRKNIAAIVLMVAGVASLVFGISSILRPQGPPKFLDNELSQKIDRETYELIAMTGGEWKKLGQKNGRFKNPKTGEYNMARSKRCASCRERIPWPEGVDPLHLTPEDVINTMCPLCGREQFPANLFPGRRMMELPGEGRPE